ncbi:MAG: hypothetical protein OYL97_24310 [Candidatus Poribacteria bacterium]|nr:hypothetical protein [Candidatus Poribacteria bacterium]
MRRIYAYCPYLLGTVNILDLVAVANGFGKDTPDVNGDGIVNILDLVAVANALEQ